MIPTAALFYILLTIPMFLWLSHKWTSQEVYKLVWMIMAVWGIYLMGSEYLWKTTQIKMANETPTIEQVEAE